MHSVVVLSDHQIPYHNLPAVTAIRKYLKRLQPDEIIYNGDLMDFPYLASRKLRRAVNKGRLLEDLSLGRDLLAADRRAAPNARITWLPGNHEERWWTYVEEEAEELTGLLDQDLSLGTVFGLADLEIRLVGRYGPHGELDARWERQGLVVTHGGYASKTAAASMLGAEGSVVFGHTHRAGLAAHSWRENPNGSFAWNAGCLCNVSPDQGPLPPLSTAVRYRNQQQGFTVVIFDRHGFNVFPVWVRPEGFLGLDGRRYRA